MTFKSVARADIIIINERNCCQQIFFEKPNTNSLRHILKILPLSCLTQKHINESEKACLRSVGCYFRTGNNLPHAIVF